MEIHLPGSCDTAYHFIPVETQGGTRWGQAAIDTLKILNPWYSNVSLGLDELE